MDPDVKLEDQTTAVVESLSHLVQIDLLFLQRNHGISLGLLFQHFERDVEGFIVSSQGPKALSNLIVGSFDPIKAVFQF